MSSRRGKWTDGSIRFKVHRARAPDSEASCAQPHAMSAYSPRFHGAYLSCTNLLPRLPTSSSYFHTESTSPFTSRSHTHTLMQTHLPELHVKILMIGNSSVGKSSLLMRWSENQWLPENEASATIGVEVKVRALTTPIEASRYLINL